MTTPLRPKAATAPKLARPMPPAKRGLLKRASRLKIEAGPDDAAVGAAIGAATGTAAADDAIGAVDAVVSVEDMINDGCGGSGLASRDVQVSFGNECGNNCSTNFLDRLVA